MVQDLDIKQYGLNTKLKDFVKVYDIHENCPISGWCLDRGESTIGEELDNFLALAKKNATFARIAHYHAGFLLEEDIRKQFVEAVKQDTTQAALMYLEDATISLSEANSLRRAVMCPKRGASAYSEMIKKGELVPVEHGQSYNLDSDITRAFIERNG